MFDYCDINSSSWACLHHVNCKVCTKTIFFKLLYMNNNFTSNSRCSWSSRLKTFHPRSGRRENDLLISTNVVGCLFLAFLLARTEDLSRSERKPLDAMEIVHCLPENAPKAKNYKIRHDSRLSHLVIVGALCFVHPLTIQKVNIGSLMHRPVSCHWQFVSTPVTLLPRALFRQRMENN